MLVKSLDELVIEKIELAFDRWRGTQDETFIYEYSYYTGRVFEGWNGWDQEERTKEEEIDVDFVAIYELAMDNLETFEDEELIELEDKQLFEYFDDARSDWEANYKMW